MSCRTSLSGWLWIGLLTLAPTYGLFAAVPTHGSQDDETGFVALFDGKTLAGWEGKQDVFRIEGDAIVAGELKNPIPRNEFLCTEKVYKDFELRLSAKLLGPGNNAGVQFRSARIPDHHEVKGYQCDMGDYPEQCIWGSLYDESRRNRFLAHGDKDEVAKAYRRGEWNDFVIRCEGDRIQIWLNGVQTVDYTETEADVAREGVIALQVHGGEPCEAWYKNIRIKSL